MPLERFVVEVKITLNHIADDFELGVTRERHLTREHDVKNDAHRPDVNFLVVLLKENFRGNVVWLQIEIRRMNLPNQTSWS